jgi:hypothetical protein
MRTQEREMNAIRRNILVGVLRRLEAMNFGYTYIERGLNGGIENHRLRPFASFGECCAAAEQAVVADSARPLQCTQVIYCRYAGEECIPEIQPILKTFEGKKAYGCTSAA